MKAEEIKNEEIKNVILENQIDITGWSICPESTLRSMIKACMDEYAQSRITELEAENKHLKKENFQLADYQCHNPTSSEYGDMLCKDKIALQDLSSKLNKALKVMVVAFDIFGKSAQQNAAIAIAKAALALMEENK